MLHFKVPFVVVFLWWLWKKCMFKFSRHITSIPLFCTLSSSLFITLKVSPCDHVLSVVSFSSESTIKSITFSLFLPVMIVSCRLQKRRKRTLDVSHIFSSESKRRKWGHIRTCMVVKDERKGIERELRTLGFARIGVYRNAGEDWVREWKKIVKWGLRWMWNCLFVWQQCQQAKSVKIALWEGGEYGYLWREEWKEIKKIECKIMNDAMLSKGWYAMGVKVEEREGNIGRDEGLWGERERGGRGRGCGKRRRRWKICKIYKKKWTKEQKERKRDRDAMQRNKGKERRTKMRTVRRAVQVVVGLNRCCSCFRVAKERDQAGEREARW